MGFPKPPGPQLACSLIRSKAAGWGSPSRLGHWHQRVFHRLMGCCCFFPKRLGGVPQAAWAIGIICVFFISLGSCCFLPRRLGGVLQAAWAIGIVCMFPETGLLLFVSKAAGWNAPSRLGQLHHRKVISLSGAPARLELGAYPHRSTCEGGDGGKHPEVY